MLNAVQPLVTALITAAITVVGGATPFVIGWMKSYFSVRENASMNQVITTAASREAAMLLSQVPDLKAVQIGHPVLVERADDILKLYPEYTDRLGMDLERTQRVVLGEAYKLYNTGLVPVPSVSASVVSVTTMATVPDHDSHIIRP